MVENKSISISFDEFINLNTEKISNICQKEHIDTLYFPIDGTRTFYELFNEKGISEWNSFALEDYLELTRKVMIKLFTFFFEYGIKNLIVLAMDESAFNRDSSYVAKLINTGLLMTIEHADYLKFYDDYNIQVIISGFNHLYTEFGHGDIIPKMLNLEEKTRHFGSRRLFIHTGKSVNDDPIELAKFINLKFSKFPTKDDIILKLYKYPLQQIHLSIWYGQPRDKLFPPLIIGNSARVYMENPSLSLTKSQFLLALYSAIILKQSHLDSFNRTIKNKKEKLKEYSTIKSLIGGVKAI